MINMQQVDLNYVTQIVKAGLLYCYAHGIEIDVVSLDLEQVRLDMSKVVRLLRLLDNVKKVEYVFRKVFGEGDDDEVEEVNAWIDNFVYIHVKRFVKSGKYLIKVYTPSVGRLEKVLSS